MNAQGEGTAENPRKAGCSVYCTFRADIIPLYLSLHKEAMETEINSCSALRLCSAGLLAAHHHHFPPLSPGRALQSKAI